VIILLETLQPEGVRIIREAGRLARQGVADPLQIDLVGMRQPALEAGLIPDIEGSA